MELSLVIHVFFISDILDFLEGVVELFASFHHSLVLKKCLRSWFHISLTKTSREGFGSISDLMDFVTDRNIRVIIQKSYGAGKYKSVFTFLLIYVFL